MSYDLTFSDPRLDSDAVSGDTAPAAEVWRRVVECVGPHLANVEPSLNDAYGELSHEETGIHLQLTATTASISMAYWHFEEPANAIRVLYLLAGIVEQETGLVGTDPQMGMSVQQAGQHLDLVVSAYANVAAMFARRARTEARIAARRASRSDAP
ncbi:MAG TPA: hypothetical protein VKB59_13885 [Micromonosporaceae bacterium]|nr:hypothetical protein [Micromonosporaceae bacterium]